MDSQRGRARRPRERIYRLQAQSWWPPEYQGMQGARLRVDAALRDDLLDRLNAIPGMLVRSTCAGHGAWPFGVDPLEAALRYGPSLIIRPISRGGAWRGQPTLTPRVALSECTCERRCGDWTISPTSEPAPSDRVSWFEEAVVALETLRVPGPALSESAATL